MQIVGLTNREHGILQVSASAPLDAFIFPGFQSGEADSGH